MSSSVTLCEELILLTLSDDGKLLRHQDDFSVLAAVAGACLMDLALLGRVDNDLEKIFVVNDARTEEAHLDLALEVLGRVGNECGLERGAADIYAHAGRLYSLAFSRLINRGIIEPREETFAWVLKTRKYPQLDDTIQTEAKQKIFNILTSKDVPTSSEVALVTLAYETDILSLFMSGREIKRLTGRIQDISGLEITLQVVRQISSAIKAQIALASAPHI
jgi:hypothetical protein